jgi:hypothetical protein
MVLTFSKIFWPNYQKFECKEGDQMIVKNGAILKKVAQTITKNTARKIPVS